MTPYAAALFAARSVRETFPDQPSTGVVLQVVAPTAILSLTATEVPEALALADALASLGDQLILVADVYHAIMAADVAAPAHGDLQERHAIGDPTVTEALIVVDAKRTEEAPRITVMPYTRDTGAVRWGVPHQLRDGPLADALADALATSPPPTVNTAAAMRWAADQLTDNGYTADVTLR